MQAPEQLKAYGLALTCTCVHMCAQATRVAYEQELIQIMHQYGVVNEFELVSGCISKFAKHRRKKGDVKALIMDAVCSLRRRYLRWGALNRQCMHPCPEYRLARCCSLGSSYRCGRLS